MNAKPVTYPKHILILDNIRSSHNVGSLFRIADNLGISEIILVGVTPAPIDRFGRSDKKIGKTALGAEKTISWTKESSALNVLEKYKRQEMHVVAIEQSRNSVDYKKVVISSPTVFIVGNEVNGIDQDVLLLCDEIAEIPLLGQKESLNVAVAAGIALFRMLDS